MAGNRDAGGLQLKRLADGEDGVGVAVQRTFF
jgi:hypothetical protein